MNSVLSQTTTNNKVNRYFINNESRKSNRILSSYPTWHVVLANAHIISGIHYLHRFLKWLGTWKLFKSRKCQNALCNLQECVNLHMPLIIARRLQPRLPHTTIISIWSEKNRPGLQINKEKNVRNEIYVTWGNMFAAEKIKQYSAKTVNNALWCHSTCDMETIMWAWLWEQV